MPGHWPVSALRDGGRGRSLAHHPGIGRLRVVAAAPGGHQVNTHRPCCPGRSCPGSADTAAVSGRPGMRPTSRGAPADRLYGRRSRSTRRVTCRGQVRLESEVGPSPADTSLRRRDYLAEGPETASSSYDVPVRASAAPGPSSSCCHPCRPPAPVADSRARRRRPVRSDTPTARPSSVPLMPGWPDSTARAAASVSAGDRWP